jgi:carbon-monoxide dehydrogenase medium subunit
MYPRSFEYTVAGSVDEACALLAQHGDNARLLAGGQSLIPLMKLRLANPSHIIDIGNIRGLDGITEIGGDLRIGALATHAAVLDHRAVRQSWPLIADAVGVIADPQVRNWGTVGGALAEADPAGDWGAVALALNARVRCLSPRGERLIDAESLFVDAYTTKLAGDELIVEVIFPAPRQARAGAYLKLERRAGDFAVISVGVQLALSERDVCEDARIALAAAGLTPILALRANEFLTGKQLNATAIDEAAQLVAAATQPLADIRGSESYKRSAAAELFRDALDLARRRAHGEEALAGHVR